MLARRGRISPRLRAKLRADAARAEEQRMVGVKRFEQLGDGKAKPGEVRAVLAQVKSKEEQQRREESAALARSLRPP
eukprot:CAMPEP_0174867372 /NCGR_PEP_ID=MMETSP1114-20130205/63884_1 /TAXON_ID=312471 /ORGANISM="Neobodo designis, Strain CCAP 1951/1" /LENGTH=76 /DNA_ID=CAMNT_0016102561 /DNA_START=1 /DNA_END=227 /DNA_ORIENTATION=-